MAHSDATTTANHAPPWASRLVIAGMLLAAVVAAIAAIGYLRGLSRRSLEFWGPPTAELILHAPRVELVEFSADGVSEAPRQRDASQARGLANVRRALMQDASFDWPSPAPLPARWDYALRFRDGNRQATLLFSHYPPRAALDGRNDSVSTRPIAAGLRAFFSEQLAEPTDP